MRCIQVSYTLTSKCCASFVLSRSAPSALAHLRRLCTYIRRVHITRCKQAVHVVQRPNQNLAPRCWHAIIKPDRRTMVSSTTCRARHGRRRSQVVDVVVVVDDDDDHFMHSPICRPTSPCDLVYVANVHTEVMMTASGLQNAITSRTRSPCLHHIETSGCIMCPLLCVSQRVL